MPLRRSWADSFLILPFTPWPPHRLVHPLPLSQGGNWKLDCALVCFGPRPKRSRCSIHLPRPVGPFACSGRANLPSKHTHMSAEAYPPDGPQISPRQGSQNFSARAGPVAGAVPCASARMFRVLRRIECALLIRFRNYGFRRFS